MRMFHGFRGVLLCTSAMACGTESKVGTHNAMPVAQITSHAEGATVTTERVNMVGQVSDADSDAADLEARWEQAGVVICDYAPPDESGATACEMDLPEGTTEVVLAARDPDNAVGLDAVTLYRDVTDAPEANITTPRDGDGDGYADGTFYSDVKISFSGHIADTEDEASDLTVVWSSDEEESIDIETTVDSDGTVTGFGYLSAATHALTLRVTDTDGKTGSDSVLIEVGPPNTGPSCEITSPETDALLTPGAAVTLTGVVSDPEQDADTLSVLWTSDRDGPIGTSSPTSAGDVIENIDSLNFGPHILTLTVTDDPGLVCTDAVVISVGSPPTVIITAPIDGAILPDDGPTTLVATVADAEDPATALSLAWNSSLEGPLGSLGPDATGTASMETGLSLGIHTLTATVSDSHGQTGTDTVEITIDDVPEVTDVQISPDPPHAGDTLTCSWTFIDSSTTDHSTASWAINGMSMGTGTSFAGGFVRADEVRCTVTPSDGVLTGTEASDTVVVENSAPSMASATITPNPATGADSLTCIGSGYADPDGDPDLSQLAWTIGGAVVGTSASLAPQARDTVVNCSITPSDGIDDGVPVTDSLTISNTPPAILALDLGPSGATTNTLLTTTATTTDADGDPVILSYAWTVDAGPIAETGPTLSGVTWFDKDQVVQVTATPDDGDDLGHSVLSIPLTIANSPPTAPIPSISPIEPVEGEDDLICALDTPSTDADSDPISYTITWERNDAAWTGSVSTTVDTGDTISAADTLADDVWTCIITPTDGTDDGALGEESVTIDNAETRVFVTRDSHNGDMGGPTGADDICTAAAADAGLGGSWKAFLSGGGTNAITRVADGPYHRLDGMLIAVDRADLGDGNINVPINIDEYMTGGINAWVYTGSTAYGTASGGSTASGGNCVGWTRGCGVCGTPLNHWYGHSGKSSRSDEGWLIYGNHFCHHGNRLYCFED